MRLEIRLIHSATSQTMSYRLLENGTYLDSGRPVWKAAQASISSAALPKGVGVVVCYVGSPAVSLVQAGFQAFWAYHAYLHHCRTWTELKVAGRMFLPFS